MKQSVLEYKKLLEQEGLLVEFAEPEGKEGEDRPVTLVTYFSGGADQGTLFLCKGAAFKEAYLKDAVNRGAVAYVSEKKYEAGKEIPALIVNDARKAQFVLGEAFYDYPAKSLHVTALTGTKGKTTTAYYLQSMLDACLKKQGGNGCALLSSIEYYDGKTREASTLTTPESLELCRHMRNAVDAGLSHMVMEVSSQGLMLHRTAGFVFDFGIFTNIEPDHIGPNEHKDFDDYLHCKGLLFKQCKVGIVNADDEHVQQVLEGHTCTVETYGLHDNADLWAKDLKLVTGKGVLGIDYEVQGLMDFPVEIDLPGKFSVYNSLTAIAICRHFGVSEENIQKALRAAKVKGRIEMVKVSDEFTLMIDYAHNAMSLESLLTTLKEYKPKRLVCLFGCGGNRSKLRRYEMGEVSGKLADLTIITSDNPRNEEPQAIIDDIKIGIGKTDGKYVEIIDRKEAIAYAIHNGQPGDVIVLAGKGHEDYQEIKGKKYPMDERDLIRDILAGK
mgnify:CR=1 FL=1